MLPIAILFILEFVGIAFAVELMSRRMPRKLVDASEANCLRMDGTRSERRTLRERRAQARIRLDLWGAFLIVALVTNGLVIGVHVFVIPLDVATSSVGKVAKGVDDPAWDLRHERAAFEKSVRRQWGATADGATDASRALWNAWPIAVFAGIGWLVLVVTILHFAYQRSLEEFRIGVARRSEMNAVRDLSRPKSRRRRSGQPVNA